MTEAHKALESHSIRPKAIRIKDVALEAGVSTATVSHVINNTKFVTGGTREKVLSAIEQFHYYPNAHARTLASGRSNIIGLLVSDISNPFFPELVKSVEETAFESGYNVILVNTNYDAGRAADYVRRLIELKVAGVALMTSELDPALIDELASKQVRVVFHNLGTAGEHMSNIKVDYAAGIEEAVQHLVSLGHRNVVHIAGPNHFRSAVIRREAFLNSMTHHFPRARKPVVYEGNFKFDGGQRAAKKILGAGNLPTAVVAANDMMALGAMQQFRAGGLTIPQDISIIGFDDIAFAALSDPPLTTVCSPRTEIGRKAIEALISTINHPGQKGGEFEVTTYLVTRGSTAPARKSNGLQTSS